MIRTTPALAILTMSTVLAACAPASKQAALPDSNPFAAPSPLPFQYPQFDRVKDTDFAPAFDAGMAAELAEVRAIADNP
jgi:peptidyl-dipeptidase Dcp